MNYNIDRSLISHITGWTDDIRNSLTLLARIKFGENEMRFAGPTLDAEANRMLDVLMGAIGYKTNASRAFFRVIIMHELYRYITTGDYDRDLVKRVREYDKVYWENGELGSRSQRKLEYKP